jgi:hypothetical protein
MPPDRALALAGWGCVRRLAREFRGLQVARDRPAALCRFHEAPKSAGGFNAT